jgi:hypothetical protein
MLSAPIITLLAALASAWAPAPLAQTAPPGVELPAPTGRYPVATTSWRVADRSRPETFAGAGEFRQVEVVAWYPAASRGGTVAPYLREGLSEVRAFAKLFGSESAFDGLERVRTHAGLDGPPATAPGKFPVLLFSHGYTGIPSAYTALLEDLASHGYAVLSIVHPYEATGATLADGRVVTLLDEGGSCWRRSAGVPASGDRGRDDGERTARRTLAERPGCCVDTWRGCLKRISR